MKIQAIIQRLRARPDSEHEQALARIIIGIVSAAYVLTSYAHDAVRTLPEPALLITLLFISVSFLLFIAIIIWPAISIPRRVFALVMDIAMITFAMWITDEIGAVLFPIYLWIIVGYGIRYGQRYLYAAMLMAIIGFVYVMLANPFWIGQRTIAAGILVGLTVLPIFFSSLLRRLGKSNLQLQKLSEEMTRLAMHDSVTGLANRVLLQERLNQAVSLSHRHRNMLGVLFIDLDGFKAINDQWGHKAGDDLLRACAQRLLDCVRETDTVARLGGDEFVVLLTEVHSADDAQVIADKILTKLRVPFPMESQELTISASIGIALYPGSGDCAESLLRNADQAMYAAKHKGKNSIAFYTAQHDLFNLPGEIT
jgi:diguanylate cyclase (GGDEF)-like protein